MATSTDESTKNARPEPLPAEQRAAILARFELVGFKSFNTHDGYAFEAGLKLDGKKIIRVTNGGRGGDNEYEPVKYTKGLNLREWREEVLTPAEMLARDWFRGCDFDLEMREKYGDNGVTHDALAFLVEEKIREIDSRKWLMAQTRGGKTVLFQADGDIGGENWKLFKRVRPDQIQKAVEASKAKGKRVRVVYRAGAGLKELRDEVFGG